MILWRDDARYGRTVVACCRRSRHFGVRNGLPIAQAVEWVSHQVGENHSREKQPSGEPVNAALPLVLEHDVVADAVALEQLAGAFQYSISPLVAMETLGKRPWAGRSLNEPDTLFCDLSGVTHLFENEQGVLSAAHRTLAEFGWTGKLSIADNAAAAWALARFHPENDYRSQDLRADLDPVPVEGLRLESETKYTLDRLGIETIGALLRLPRSGLASRLGETLLQRIAEALGEREVELRMHHPDIEYLAEHELEYPTEDLLLLGDRVERLCQKIANQLRDRRRGAIRVLCRLDLIDHDPRPITIGLFAPTQDAQHLSELIECSMDSMRLPGLVTKVTLRVLQSGAMRTQQQSLFAGSASELDPKSVSAQRLARLIDSLSTRLGADAVLGVRLSENPLPEKAYRTYRLTDFRTRQALRRLPSKQRPRNRKQVRGTSDQRGRRYRPPAQTDARRRPLRLLRRPIELQPAQKPDHVKLHDPRAFRIEKELHRVTQFWGPERIESGWWSGPSVRRHYYRVETSGGRIWWIFQDLATGRWFMHGRFT